MQSKPGGHRPLAPQLSLGSHHSISATPTAAATSRVTSSSAVRHHQCHRSVSARATRTFFFSLSRPACDGNIVVFAARKNGGDGLRASDLAPATGMQDKKTTTRAPPVGGARDVLPRRNCGTRPYRASLFWDFGTRCTSFAVRGLRNVFLRRRPPTFHSARVQPCCSA